MQKFTACEKGLFEFRRGRAEEEKGSLFFSFFFFTSEKKKKRSQPQKSLFFPSMSFDFSHFPRSIYKKHRWNL